jgi:hypothetical protein
MHQEVEVYRLAEKPDLERLVAEFLAKHPEWGMDPEGSDGECIGRSEEFGRWLRTIGIESQRLEMGSFRAPVDEDASLFHRDGMDVRYFYHCVVLVGDVVVDLSGAQFGMKYARLVWPELEFRRLWEKGHKSDWEF